jgi:hypothetical protein
MSKFVTLDAEGPSGDLLAVNPDAVTHIESVYVAKLEEHQIRLHLTNSRFLPIPEADAGDVLEALGLGALVEEEDGS